MADVGRAVHGEHAHLGQDVVHDGEDGLLNFARVLGAADDNHLLFIVGQDGSLAAGPVDFGDALEAGSRNNGVIGLEVHQVFLGGAAQQLVNEQVLAGQLVDDAETLHVLLVCAGKAVKDEDFAVLQVGDHLAVNGVIGGLVNGTVHLAPGDLVVYGRGIDDELIVSAAAGVLAGFHHQRAGVAQRAFAAGERLFRQNGDGKVAVDFFGGGDAQVREIQTHGRFLPLWY